MSRTAAAVVAATVLGAALFGAAPAAGTVAILLVAAGLLSWGLATRPPHGWGLRAVVALLAGYLVIWSVNAARTWRLSGEDAVRLEASARQRTAAALSERLAEDRALADLVAARLAGDLPRPLADSRQAELFQALGRAAPGGLPEGVGLELYDGTGALRAWWGDPRGGRLPPDSVAAAAHGELVRRSAGYALAYAGAHLPVPGDTLHVVVKDVWRVDSPLRKGAAEEDLILARLSRKANLTVRLLPIGSTAPAASAATTPVMGPSGEPRAQLASERFRLDDHMAGRRDRAERILALLLLWPLVWATAATWQGSPRLVTRAAVVALLAVFLLETPLLHRLLPEAWFSPVAFASTAFGPAGRSPGDLLVVAGLAFLLALAMAALLPRRPVRESPWMMVAALAAGLGVAAAAVRAAAPLLEEAMQSMSAVVFFSPTLLFSPPQLMVLLAFALFVGVVVIGLAALGRVAGVPAGAPWGIGAALVAAAAVIAAAVAIPDAAMAGARAPVAVPLTVAVVAAGWAVRSATAAGQGDPASPRTGLLAALAGALVVLPLAGFARVEAANELLVERAERIGLASSQWIDFTMARTVAFLSAETGLAEAIEEANRDAALGLWSNSPLRELDFATGIYLFDAEGGLVSQFSLAPEDLTARARRIAGAVESAGIAVRGSEGTSAARWAVVPVAGDTTRAGAVVAMTTGAVELRERPAGDQFVLTDLLEGAGPEPDLPGYTTLGPGETPPPRTLLTSVRREDAAEGEPVLLAMPLDPLLPGPRTYAVFAVVALLAGLAIGTLERAGEPRARARWRTTLARQNPLSSFRVQLLVAFLVVAALPLGTYAALSYRATRIELEEATRSAAAEALVAASRLLERDDVLERVDDPALSARLREIAAVLQQDLVLYWRGRTVASSRPEIFASRLFAERIQGSVIVDLYAVGLPIVFDATGLGERSFLVAYRALTDPGLSPGYVIATPLLIREDRARVDIQRLGEGVFLLSALSIGFLLAVGMALARFMAHPLSELERGTRQIAAGRLDYRLPEPGRPDEFGRLQRAFNAMAEGLDASQRALEREKRRVQAILASVGAGVVALDADGRVRLLNDRAAELLDQRPARVIARSATELAEADGPAAPFWRLVAGIRAGAAGRAGRDLVLEGAGGPRHLHVVFTALQDGAGDARGIVVAFEDITANVESQRVLAWGEMARQVAHEIKNPLTPMKLSLQHLERAADDRAPDFERTLHDNIDLVLSEIDRLEKIAGNFARFAVPDPAVAEPFDALAVARDVIALFAPGEEGIDYRLETAGEPVPLLGEDEGFHRILVNLLQNAREAVLAAGDGGRIEVRFDFAGDPGQATVQVIDDGVGLPRTGAERLFEPSFSTKTRGTGLGLAITRRIVEAWGGEIGVERRERGTAFRLRLRTG